MRINRILFLFTTLLAPQFAADKLPMPNDAFGKMEGTLDFCTQADAQSAAKYHERKKAMVQGVPDQEVAEARSTTEYKDGYHWITAELGKVPKDQAVGACRNYLEGK